MKPGRFLGKLSTMRLKILVILLGLIASFTPMTQAHSVYGGTDATGSPLVLTLLTSKDSRISFCSMALLTERIVATAAHCVIEDQGVAPNLRWSISNLYVSQPGADVTKDDVETRVRVLKVITRDDFINTWKPEIRDYRTQINDIAFLFLEKPLATGYSVEIATDEEINLAISRGALVTHYGYGLQAPNVQSHSPWMTQLPLVDRSSDHLEKTKVVYSNEGPTAMCPGDSGGPWYINVGGVMKIAAVMVAASGCRGTPPYTGGTLGTRIAPYLSMMNTKWEEFLRTEKADEEARQLKIAELEKIRLQGVSNGRYIPLSGCHVPGINAELQFQDLDGNWVLDSPAIGWLPSEASCPKTHTTRAWAVTKSTEGSLLRWRLWTSSWEIFGDVFKWNRPIQIQTQPLITSETATQKSSSATTPSVKRVSITCVKGKQTKKVLNTKLQCPNGWKQKKR